MWALDVLFVAVLVVGFLFGAYCMWLAMSGYGGGLSWTL